MKEITEHVHAYAKAYEMQNNVTVMKKTKKREHTREDDHIRDVGDVSHKKKNHAWRENQMLLQQEKASWSSFYSLSTLRLKLQHVGLLV